MSLVKRGIARNRRGIGLANTIAAPAFTPATRAADLLIWIRPDAANITLNGSNIITCNDMSGLARNVTEGTDANRPTYIASDSSYNNQPTMSWPNAFPNAQKLTSVAWGSTHAAPMTVYWVGEQTGNTAVLYAQNSTTFPFGQINGGSRLSAVSGKNITAAYRTSTIKGVHCHIINGVSSSVYVNSNGFFPGVTGDAGSTGISRIVIGNNSGGTAGIGLGKIAEFIIVAGADSPAQIRQMYEYFCSRYASIDTHIIFSGNSLTAGFNASNIGVTDFVNLIGLALPGNYGYVQDGHAGFTTAQLMNGNTGLPSAKMARRKIALLWEIVADIITGGVDQATAIANLTTWCTTYHKEGYKVAVGTAIAIGVAGWTPAMEAIRLAVNDQVRNTFVSGGICEAVVDFAADPRLQDPTDHTYYDTDNQHLVDAGHQVCADIAGPILLGMSS